MRLAYFCFVAAALCGLSGMSLGIWMGMHEDFTLAPVHAHINLLGWVTLALYGSITAASSAPRTASPGPRSAAPRSACR